MANHSGLRAMLVAALVAVLLAGAPHAQVALGTAITYQGRLTDAGLPANGSYDLQFTMYDAATGGAALGATVTLNAVTVTAGVFTVSPDFGAGVFAGNARWLEVRVGPGTNGAFTTLSPRQALMPAPQSLHAVTAATATMATSAATATAATTATSASQLAGQLPAFYLSLANQTGTLSVAQGGTGATSLAGLQARVTGTCLTGTTLLAVNSDGTVSCVADAPRAGVSVATVDTGPSGSASEGHNTSITIGADGLGLISYYDNAADDLKVAHCSNAVCSAATAATLDSGTDAGGDVGQYTSITIGTDGLGLISYYDVTNGDLKVAHCENTACSSATRASIDTGTAAGGNVGRYTSITIGTDGLGLVSYYDVTNGDLKVAHCANVACSSISGTASLDTAADVGHYTSVVIGADGLGLISYFDNTNRDLKVAHCSNTACSVSATPVTLDSAGQVGVYTSVVIGPDGLGLIAYRNSFNGDLKTVHCLDVVCSASTAPAAVLTTAGPGGLYSTIAIGADGLGVIGYWVTATADLKVAHCTDITCSTATLATVDSGDSVGQAPAITIGADGLALISYYDFSNGNLKVAHCGNVSCSPFVVRRR